MADAPLTAADLEKAKADAIAGERSYRKMFSTIVTSTGLSGKAAEEFESTFYGRAESDLKFLASHAIGSRAKAVGEGSGRNEPQAGEKAGEDPAAVVEAEAGKRFDTEAVVRKQFSVTTNDPNSDQWKTARGRYLAAARRSFLAGK